MNSLIMVEIGGKAVRTLPKDVAFHPVTDRPLHVDFLRLSKDATVDVSVPVLFVNEEASPGLKRGGVLNVVRHELELVCDAARIPDEIEIDVTGLEVGDSIHISSVKLPKGSESAITDRDYTIATVVAPSALKRADGEAAGDGEEGEDEAPSEGGEG
jgi:large subunit ribosomal protein L25